jgi:6-phosphogluconolactonase
MGQKYAYVGCRTSVKRNARGKGIKVYKIETGTGLWQQIQLVKGLENPSFLAFDKEKKFLYSVHGDGKIISAFKINKNTGELYFLNKQRTGFDFSNSGIDASRGYNPVHLAVAPDNRYIIVANHAAGNITVHPRNMDGTVEPYITIMPVKGNPISENGEISFSRPHQICFDATGKYILVPAQGRLQGNGMDKVVVYRFDGINGVIKEIQSVPTRLRSWPRHIALHPNNRFAYIINEWDNTVTGFSFDALTGSLKPFQVIPSLPETYVGDGQAAEILIHSSGKYVYASNRIHDSIVIYSVDQVTGFLMPVSWVGCQGRTPRFMGINSTSDYLYVANEDSDEIVEFLIDRETGLLKFTGQVIETESPVCIVFS